MNYAVVQTKKVGIEVLRSTGIREVNKRLKNKEIFNTITNNNGEIESIDFNTSVINETNCPKCQKKIKGSRRRQKLAR